MVTATCSLIRPLCGLCSRARKCFWWQRLMRGGAGVDTFRRRLTVDPPPKRSWDGDPAAAAVTRCPPARRVGSGHMGRTARPIDLADIWVYWWRIGCPQDSRPQLRVHCLRPWKGPATLWRPPFPRGPSWPQPESAIVVAPVVPVHADSHPALPAPVPLQASPPPAPLR